MRRHLIALLLLWALASCGEDVQLRLAGLVHYDDFPGAAIDSSKWTVDVTGDGSTGTASATVANGQATLDLTASTGNIQSSLVFPTALVGQIGRFSTRVTLLSYTQGGASSNVRFRLYIRPYKDNKYASGAAPDVTSDIYAAVRFRQGPGSVEAQAMVSRCITSTCSSSENPFGPVVLGPVTLNQPYDLSLVWDGGTGFWFNVAGIGSAYFDTTEGGTYAKIGPSGSSRAKVELIADSGAPTTGTARVLLDSVDCSRRGADLC